MVPQVRLTPHSLFGTSPESVTLPLPDGASIDIGPISVTLDHRSDERGAGTADLTTGTFSASLMIQATAPGLYELVTVHGFDPQLVGPIRLISRWQGRYTPEGQLEAQGELEFLQGSLWAGTTGRTACSSVCSDCAAQTVQGDQPFLKLVESFATEGKNTPGHLIYMACPCPFELTFPPRFGGAEVTVTIKGILTFLVTYQTFPTPSPETGMELPILWS